MTVGELKDLLEDIADDRHIVLAVTEPLPALGKMEIRDFWGDASGVINLLLGRYANELDPAIWSENEIPEPKGEAQSDDG